MMTVEESLEKFKELKKDKERVIRRPTETLYGKPANGGNWRHDKSSVASWHVSQSEFPHLYVDATHSCNSKCNMCFNPDRPEPPLNLEYYEKCVSQLPTKTEIVLIGGEPTLHPRFFDVIRTTFKYGHGVYLSTNGKILSKNMDFARELKEVSKLGKLRIHLDCSGGKAEPGFAGEGNKLYQIIHNEPVYEEKIQCLENLRELGIGRVTLSGVIIRKVNEGVLADLLSLADDYKEIIREVAFRSQGNVGRFIGNEKPYTTNEYLLMMFEKKLATKEQVSKVLVAGFLDKRCEGKHCCYYFQKRRGLVVSWTNFLCHACWKRGQLGEGTERVEHFFEYLESNDFNTL